jgi:hypothetical protein
MSNKEKERILISFEYALKRLLRDKANYDIVGGFLSELLEYDVVVTKVIERKTLDNKYSRLEIQADNEEGELIEVELLFSPEKDCYRRMLYGSSELLVETANFEEWHCELRKVISINIDLFSSGQGSDYIYYKGMRFNGIHADDELQLSYIQRRMYGKKTLAEIYPEYYILTVCNFDDVMKDKLDEWIYYFKYNNIKDEFTAKGLDKARKILDYNNLTSEEQVEYDRLSEMYRALKKDNEI